MPVWNAERYLAEAIDSVLAQLQTDIEIIVVDDGSSDASATVARSYREPVRCYSTPNRGTAAARNKGLAHAKGRYLAHLDADDVWVEHRLEKQLNAFARQPDADIVSGRLRQFHSPDLDAAASSRLANPVSPMPGEHLGAMLIKREAQARVGRFETRWTIGQDMDWYLKAVVERGLRVVMLDDLVLLRRLHDANKGITHRQHAAQRMHILKASIDRRRSRSK